MRCETRHSRNVSKKSKRNFVLTRQHALGTSDQPLDGQPLVVRIAPLKNLDRLQRLVLVLKSQSGDGVRLILRHFLFVGATKCWLFPAGNAWQLQCVTEKREMCPNLGGEHLLSSRARNTRNGEVITSTNDRDHSILEFLFPEV